MPNRGKSGSARVLYIDFAYYEQLFLLNVYAKSDKENISDKEKAAYNQAIGQLESALKGDGEK